ncbi:hypothetical protein T10_1467 [Trichinella papuae]|uniref:Uncharacterized protein n=1 Tax=Trichinella papuae TaxID=268474 RepID=A0A0V1MZV0_9BILA|nr:hypothetical protein T10_8737 [Trichinella papuae]KRZ77207.1 hypothetical protein T10_1467 [Trichinella papuae]
MYVVCFLHCNAFILRPFRVLYQATDVDRYPVSFAQQQRCFHCSSNIPAVFVTLRRSCPTSHHLHRHVLH